MPPHNELRELFRQFDEACDSLARHSLLRETAQETIDYWERRKSTLLLELESLLNRAPAEGWVVVPREPTREMLKAADAVDNAAYCGGSMHGADLEDLWHAMLAAAPAAPVADYSRSKEWCTKMAQQEPDCDITVGAPAAEGELIHVNVTGGDVFEAPLKATGFADGIPRFVVTIPAQASNDEDRAIANAYRRWAGMVKPEGLNEPFAEFVRATVEFIAEHSRSSKAASPAVEPIAKALAIVDKVAMFNGGFVADDLRKVEATLNACAAALRSYSKDKWGPVANYSDNYWYIAGEPWQAADALLKGHSAPAVEVDEAWNDWAGTWLGDDEGIADGKTLGLCKQAFDAGAALGREGGK